MLRTNSRHGDFGKQNADGSSSGGTDNDLQSNLEAVTKRHSSAAVGHFRELSDRLVDTTEQLRQASDKTTELEQEIASLRYKVNLYGDDIRESKETNEECRRQIKTKSGQIRQKDQALADVQRQLECALREIAIKDQLIHDSGLQFVENGHENGTDNVSNGSNGHGPSLALSTSLLPVEFLAYLDDTLPVSSASSELQADESDQRVVSRKPSGSLPEQLRRFVAMMRHRESDCRRLENELHDVKRQLLLNNGKSATIDVAESLVQQRPGTVEQLRGRIRQLEDESATLQATNSRLEASLRRYKESTEKAEASELELKADKRKLQRDLRELQSKAEELDKQNSHLQARVEKLMKTGRAIQGS